MTRRSACLLAASAVGFLAGCESDGHFKIFGYTTRPPFDPDIRTVYVPVFKNTSVIQTTPYRGVEVQITKAIVDELGSRSGAPRVVSDPECADSELVGQLVSIQKRLLNQNLQGLARETELTFTCTVVWRDLRSGKVLSNRRPPKERIPPPPQFDPSLPPLPEPAVREAPIPVTVIASGRILEELGETSASGQQMAVRQLAKQIVNMMEAPW